MANTPKLNDLQLILLATAAQREDGSVLPLPDSIVAEDARVRKTIPALLRRGRVAEAPVKDAAKTWREEDDRKIGLVITDAGRVIIAADDDDGEPHTPEDNPTQDEAQPIGPSAPRSGSKAERVLGLLRRSEGATLAELVEATGWLPHTARAALTGLRKKGHVIEKTKRGDVTCYRIAEVG